MRKFIDLFALIEITDGRAFLLFTSHRALREAARRLAARSAHPLLIQGQKPKARLLAEFRANPEPEAKSKAKTKSKPKAASKSGSEGSS